MNNQQDVEFNEMLRNAIEDAKEKLETYERNVRRRQLMNLGIGMLYGAGIVTTLVVVSKIEKSQQE